MSGSDFGQKLVVLSCSGYVSALCYNVVPFNGCMSRTLVKIP